MWQLFLYFLPAGDIPELRKAFFRWCGDSRSFGKRFSVGAGLPEVSGSIFPSARGFPKFRKELFRRRGASRSFGKRFSAAAGLPEVSESIFSSARRFPKFRKELFRRCGVFRRFGKHLNVGRRFSLFQNKLIFTYALVSYRKRHNTNKERPMRRNAAIVIFAHL